MVVTENGAYLDYMNTDEIAPQHYAFLVNEAEFDEIFGRVRERKLTYWADPARKQPGRSITMTADAASTSRTSMVTSLRSSLARTAAADGIREGGCHTRRLSRQARPVSKGSHRLPLGMENFRRCT